MHTVDLPTIVSGNRLAYLDPHEEIWPRETGQWYDIDRNARYTDTFAPFENLRGFSVQNARYNGTLFRFPLRNARRDKCVSTHTYDVNKFRELLTVLREEAKCILLFLRTVRTVEVFEISESGVHSNLLKVSICETSIDQLAQKRSGFQATLQRLFHAQSFGIREKLSQVVRVQIDVNDYYNRTTSSSKWLVANQVGSHSPEVRKLAQELKVFPWVGVALETSAQNIESSGGRVFCVLPMPLEVSCNLPVHVNGTFSLNDERRELKWRGVERKNDPSAQWNHLLVEELLPPCYASLLLDHAKMLLVPAQFCRAWPDTNKVKGTKWVGLLTPLLRALLSKDVIPFCKPGGIHRWITISSATFFPRGTVLPQEVTKALMACGVKLVTATDAIWNALTYCSIQATCVSPSLTRGELRKSPQSYTSMTSTEKHALLQYCLSDDAYYNDLSNLALLPLASGGFGTFGSVFNNPVYLCSQQCPSYLLPILEGELVNESLDYQVYTKLKEIASGGHTNLRLLTVNDVATLLSRAMQLLQFQNTVKLPWSQFTMQWLRGFWQWVPGNSLHLFANHFLVPISDRAVARLTKASSCLFIPSTQSCSQSLISTLEKLGVQCCQQRQHSFVCHNFYLSSLMNFLSAEGAIDAIQQASISYSSVTLTDNEARELIEHVHNVSINYQRQAVLRELAIFAALRNTGQELYSVAQVEASTGRGAQMEPQNFPLTPQNMPSSVILFSSANYYQRLLLSKLSVNSTTTVDLLVYTVFPLIERESLKRDDAKNLMKEVLEKFHAITSNVSYQKRQEFESAIGRLSFLPVSAGKPKPPNTLYSPSEEELKNLFYNEPVFPSEPFSGGQCLKVLKQCGLKTSVTRQEIVDIVCSISSKASTSPVAVDQVKHIRAKAVLTYIKRWGPQQLSETVHISDYPRPRYGQNLQFSQALRKLSETKSWLPVQATPPSGYPSCLTWRGSGCTRHFISFGSSVMLSEHALACGSQVYFVEHSLPQALCKEFTPSPYDVMQHVMAHLEKVILKHTQVSNVKKITFGIYHLLHKCQEQDHTANLSLLERTEDCVWLTRQKKFVHPNSIALEQNATFQHNLEPFVYILPDDLAEYESLFTELGVQEVVTRSQIMGILEKIQEGNPSSCGISNKQAWNLVMNILRWSTESDNGDEDDDNGPTLIPVEPDTDWPTLVTAEDVVYTDSAFLQRFLETSGDTEEEYTFVNHRVSPDLACQLQLTPLSEHLNISEDAFEDVGQSEPLTVRLKNILKDYKDGLTIIKELIQNADDAGATEMNICYDTRYHTDKRESLFFPGMAKCHGPALVVNNNAMFTEDDFQNITKLAGATNVGKALKIGKFGVGFCSVYHITDIPSFVSNNLFYIFDPTLTYLKDEIKNPARPGKKVCFTSPFISRSKQLAPYANLFGLDPRSKYEGTTFRFPFRTGVSELSDKMYGAEDVIQLREQIQSSCSKLVLFLQNIETITFSQVHRGKEEPHETMKITKGKQTLVGNRCIYQVTCLVKGSDTTEFWLVETCTQTVLEKYSTASVACSLSPTDEQLYEVKPIEGEMFCFLPLSVKTGLPVHVSSNFAVSNNRRGIWTSDDSDFTKSDEVEWNKSLMKGTICLAYCELLEGLKELQTEMKLSDYAFFSMWPVKGELKIQNPWYLCVKAVYGSVAERELFFSNSTDRWLALDESKFLHPDILRVSHSATSIPGAVLDVVNHLELPVVHLPSKYHEFLAISGCTETEKTFLEHFFANIQDVEAILESRNAVLLLTLECYATELNSPDKDRYYYLWEFLQENACIPCEPDGKLLKAPSELIQPEADFAKLFDVNENVFPLRKFCNKILVDRAMKELGMLHDSIPLESLEERATTIATLYKNDATKALERAKLIMDSLQKEDKREEFPIEICLRMSEIPFLPVKEKPEDYPLPWKGDRGKLYPGKEILSLTTTYYDDKANIHLAGSECVILNQNNPSNGGCGVVSYRVKELLQIRSSPTCREVISHFCTLLGHFDGSEQMIKFADPIARKVYEYLEELLGQAKEHESIDIAPIKEIPCIWTGRMFIECSAVAKKWRQDGPYLFQVPYSLNTCKYLKEALEIKEEFSDEDLVGALQSIRNNEDTPLSENCQMLIKDIVSVITSREKFQTDLKPIMLPDVDFILHEATELYHNDMPWQPHDDTFKYVHESVPLATAKRLEVKLCRTAHLARYTVPGSGFSIVEFGQHEELTRRIQNIIRDYPFDMTILKELLQNADDAKATKMHIIVDMRRHREDHILSEEWAKLQGPALLVWNDSVFTKEDLEGIQRLGLGSKRSDSETIGQYGIGFNAVYHLTDCPSFLTGGDTLCILDPHMRYVPHATERRPGAMYTSLDKKFWSSFDGMKSAYLLDGVKNRPKQLLNGTLFRFPLRYTLSHVESSEIVRDINQSELNRSRVLSGREMSKLLNEWAPKMKQSLLFLNNVTELKFSVIRDERGVLSLENSYRTELDEWATQNRSELTDKIKLFNDEETRTPFITTYPLTIVESLMARREKKEEWLIQQGIGNIDKDVQRWTYVEQVKPRHGIAAPLKCEGATLEGQVFCFLPLPLYSGLPVHINGHFILHSTRRNLWRATDSEGDNKSRWNQNILTAIASSYAKFLERMTEYVAQFKRCTSRKSIEKAVTEYYVHFPCTIPNSDSPLSEPWLQLTKHVFQAMFEHNSPILAVPTNVSARSSEDKCLLQWQPLKCEQMPASQVYFWKNARKEKEENVKMKCVLERIGMKITCAPLWVMEHFKFVKCDLPVVSRSSVHKFYVSFYNRFISSQYPRDIQDTPFKCVEDFKLFTGFLLGAESQPSLTTELAFPDKPFGYPLLLNACNQLCIFDEGSKVLRSKYAQLFPKYLERFLHKDLIRCHHSSSYFVTEFDEDRVQIVKELLQTVLPPELKNMYVSSESEEIKKVDIRALWRCFKNDKVFRSAVDEILKVWALLLTKDQKLFRCSSREQLLPIIPDSSTREAALMSVIEHQLRGPFLDTQVVPVEVVESLCPRPSDHKAVLKNVYYLHREFPFDEVMTSQIATSLITYFKNIHLKKERKCCLHLKCLPLFETMDGDVTVLEGKRVYMWPNTIGQDGNEKWIRGTDLVFLKPWGAWASLGVIIELGIQTITAEEMYIQFIFPQFFKLNKKERYSHVRYIRDYLFATNYANRKNDCHARHFVSELVSLPWIGDDGHSLKPVSSFHTDQKEIFPAFLEHFQLIPKEVYQGDKRTWMSFFQKIGLQQTVTKDTFSALCNDVACGKLKESTRASSKVLFDYLFTKEEAKHNGFHSDRNFLARVSDIAFVCPVPMPELEWIHKAPQTPNRVILANDEQVPLCKLLGSCVKLCKDLIWVVKHVIDVSEPEEKSLLDGLGICTEPTVKDVVESVKCLAKTRFTNNQLFKEYKDVPLSKPGRRKLMDVMTKIFEYLEQKKAEPTELIDLPCIPVHALTDERGSQYPVLVQPHCVVFREFEETQEFYPFIHSVMKLLYRAKDFLGLLGVKNSIELKHMQIVLQSAYEISDGLEMDINTRRVVSSAVKEIFSLLQKNKMEMMQMREEVVIEQLQPLYLSGVDKRMHLVDSLVYSAKYRPINYNLDETGLFLLWTPKKLFNIRPKQFCQLLPEAIRPKLLSQLCIRKVSTSCKKCENAPPIVDKVETQLRLQNLPQAMSIVIKYYASQVSTSPEAQEKIIEVFMGHLEQFFDSIEVKCVDDLKIDVFLKDSDHVAIASESEPCFLLWGKNVYLLYIDSKRGAHDLSTVQDCIVDELVSCLKNTEFPESEVDQVKTFMKKLFGADSPEELYDMLQEKHMSIDELTPTAIYYDHEPNIGDAVPNSLHFRLDHSLNNIFYPQEWVAYKPNFEEEIFIYAQVSHAMNLKDAEGEPLKPMLVEYIIITSKDGREEKKVTSVDLFKFLRGEKAQEKASAVESESRELVPFQGDPSETAPPPPPPPPPSNSSSQSAATARPERTRQPINIEQAKEEVRQDLKDIWQLPKEDQKKALRRLYLKWHPDKNPYDPEAAEEVFKFMQQEIDRLERGEGLTTSSSQSWRHYERAWSSTARQHRHYYDQFQQDSAETGSSRNRRKRNRGRRGRGGGGGGFFNASFTPPKNESEAKRWVKQAEADYAVLKVLLDEAQANIQLPCHVCFVAHEVAEKALKGAMYATCGLREQSRRSHNVTPLARAIEQVEPEKARGISALALPLEPTYYVDTRFPKEGAGLSVPFEDFSLADAEEAEKCAGGILKIVKDIVNT